MLMAGCIAGVSLILGSAGLFGLGQARVQQDSTSVGLLGSTHDASSFEVRDTGANAFEVIVIDWGQKSQAKALEQSISLRFPDAKVQRWSSNDRDLEPPFVMVQVRSSESKGVWVLRLLTHEGAVYVREVSAGGGRQRVQEEITRELTSTLLAIAEGLIEPDQREDSSSLAQEVPAQSVPESSPGSQPEPVSLPTKVQPIGLIKSAKPDRNLSREQWRAFLALVGVGALPLPAFPNFSSGWGLKGGYSQTLKGRWDFGGAIRWMTRSKGGVRVHRFGLLAGLGKHWNPRTSLRYALMGQVQLEGWWLGALPQGQQALPRPKGSQVLLGAALEQSLMLRLASGSAGGFWVGPQLVLGYSGLAGRRFSALALYFKEPQADENALVRLGGVELSLGLRAEFLRF